MIQPSVHGHPTRIKRLTPDELQDIINTMPPGVMVYMPPSSQEKYKDMLHGGPME